MALAVDDCRVGRKAVDCVCHQQGEERQTQSGLANAQSH